jgi:magnesium-transporting ATPase (P-type)
MTSDQPRLDELAGLSLGAALTRLAAAADGLDEREAAERLALYVFHAHAPLFRSGWFVESLATQSLVVFLIRTRRVPFFRGRPSRPLLATTLAVVAVGIAVPHSPLAHCWASGRCRSCSS